MSITHDIYNPPPAPDPLEPPRAEPIQWSVSDLAALAALCAPVGAIAAWAWSVEPTLGLWVTIAGVFVILESWFSALTFLHRHPSERFVGRWLVFLAALMPWLLSLGFGAALMIGLFRLSDWAG